MKKIIIGILTVALVTWAIIWNTKYDTPTDLHIGVIASLTGLVAGGDNLGEGFANGVRLAYEEYVAKHPKTNVTITIENDAYDAKTGVSAYKKLSSIDSIDALINLSSPTIDATKADIIAAGLPVLQLGAEANVTPDNIFQMYPDQTSIGILGVEAMKDNVQTITAVIEQVEAYEKFIADFDESFDGSLSVVRVSNTETDMRSTALKLKEENTDALLIFMSSQKGAQLIKRLQENGHKPSNLYFDIALQLGATDYQTVLGNLSFIEGAKALYATSDTDESFTATYEARFGVKPGMLAGYGYDSFNVLMATYSKDVNSWKQNIQNYKDRGVTGLISFNEQGLRPPEFEIATVRNNELVVE